MSELFEMMNNLIEYIISYLGVMGPILGCFLILCESIIPILPLSVFITLNCMTFGGVKGYIISWFFTCLGCYLSYSLFNKRIRLWFNRKTQNSEKIEKFINVVKNCSVVKLAMIVAIPFTPSSFVNISAGLANMNKKRFLTAICIGKMFMVYFWGFIGTNLIQSLTNPIILIRVVIMVMIAYLISNILNKKFNL